MDKRKRDEASSGSAIPTVAKQGGSSSQPGLTDPLPTKKPRLVSPSSVVISPVLGAPPGPKRVILKIRQPLASSTSASPAGGTPASPGLPLPATVVSTATQDTVKPVAETPEEEKKRKWKEAVAAATASAKPGETAVVNDARLSPLPSHPTKFLGQLVFIVCCLYNDQKI